MSYHGWGKFSKKFLEEITIPAPETGEVWNLITALWETNENLSQLLGKKYQFSDQIKEYNEEQNNPTLSYKTVEEQYVSPAVKRQIWQTLQVIKEIKKVMGKEPERIFVEMARESQESKRTESRKKQLIDLYKVCKEEEKEIYEKLEKHEEQHLRKDKLFLYFTQRGHCMYSGERIEFDDLWDNTKYDIDHIYPQSKTMDDSLNNRVLVKKEYKENALEYLREIMKERKLSKPVILINKIKIDTLFKVDGFYMWLSGRTGKQLIFKGANELLLSDEETKILKKVIKFINRKIENKNVKIVAFDGINEAELTHLYDVFVSKLQNTIYKIRLGLQASTLIDNKGKFEKLSLEDKCTVLAEILHLFQCQSTMANLTLISGPAKAGSIKINNNITKCKQISIINQSVTGIYEKEIDLLKL